MARHTIKQADLDEWLRRPQWQTYARSGGEGSDKVLEVDEGKVFRVTDHGETIFLGADMAAAVAAYNEAL